MVYDKVDTNLNFTEREKKVLEFWKKNDIMKKSETQRDGAELYTFYDGPPTANGQPHIGHVLTRVVKDMVPRYHSMKGRRVVRKAGWDTHGLPVELEVEKELGLDGKEQIEQYGLAPFIEKCKESVWRYKGMWEEFSDKVGFWADMDDPYVTYHNDYIESAWWSLKEIWERGLLYKGHKTVPYCPRCGTPLSSHEVAQGYKDVRDTSAIAKFKLKGEDAFFLAWTTTPWTLPSNVALCVNPRESYVKARSHGEVYILAEELLDAVLGAEHEVVERYVGKDLEYKEYEPIFDFAKSNKKGWYVTCGNFVTLSDGTGIVHIAPAFGEDDSNLGREYDLPLVQLVDGKGQMTEPTPWAGMFCKDADAPILKDLDERKLLFATMDYNHSYPHCWRCDTPLIYYARESWFIKMTAVRDDLIHNNNQINWVPPSIGKGRFGDWLENVQDWGISRNRYWGTPLPIWQCASGHMHAIGSIAELKSMSENCPDDIELHRPFIDAVSIKCPECGGEMRRVEEVIDCWYDSGAMPFAQWHYPFENKEIFEANFPANYICEAVDQTRGWFYSLLAISTLLFNKESYENVIVLGHVQDAEGQKMSKSRGNAVDPMEVLERFGADAVRWYFYENSAPWLPNRFSAETVVEGQRKFLGTLWNTYAFYVLYANIDEFDASKHSLEFASLGVMDRWLLSKLNTLTREVDAGLGEYKVTEPARALQDFVDELSNWYVRRCRERFWKSGRDQDKINAYMTLYTALTTLVKLAAPMIPFMTDDIYQNLVRKLDPAAPESVHLCDFPIADESLIDAELEENMESVLKIVALGRAARNEAALKNRQPLAGLFVNAPRALGEFYADIICDELNVKSLEFTDDMGRFMTYSFKPQLKTLGPRFGKQLGELSKVLAGLNGNEAKAMLDSEGALRINLLGEEVSFSADDLLIDVAKIEGFVTAADAQVTVALDTRLSPELIDEGFVREVISKIQTQRKDAGFEVTDHIRLGVSGSEKVLDIVRRFEREIRGDVLADEVAYGEVSGFTKEWSINGEAATLGVEKL